jgi:hypothetical protein
VLLRIKTFVAAGLSSTTAALLLALLTIASLAPFAGKAFHMDDPLFLWTARHIQAHALDFYGFTVNWYGEEMPMAEITKNPPLAAYYAAGAASLLGWSETALHLAFLLPALAVVLGTYLLAKRLCARPFLAALTTAVTPVFLVSSTSVMCDTLMLAFWVWAIVFWTRGLAEHRNWDLTAAAVLISLASLTKYFGMSLLPLLAVYAFAVQRGWFAKRGEDAPVSPARLSSSSSSSSFSHPSTFTTPEQKAEEPGERGRQRGRGSQPARLSNWIWFLLIPILVLAGYQWFTAHLYGHGLLWDAAAYRLAYHGTMGARPSFELVVGLAFAGGCVTPAWFYAPWLWSRRALGIIGGVTALLLLPALVSGQLGYMPLNEPKAYRWDIVAQAAFFISGGVNLAGLVARELWRRRDAGAVLLGLWGGGTFVFACLVNWIVNGRSLLPLAPAAGILIVRGLENKSARRGALTGWRYVLPLVPAALLTLSVTWNDCRLANSIRLAVKQMYQRYAPAGGTLWFEGHWGFQYYMQQMGGKPVDFSSSIFSAGDKLVLPNFGSNLQVPPPTMTLNQRVAWPSCRLLTTWNARAGAGFYASQPGPLPYTFVGTQLEQYAIFDVLKPCNFQGEQPATK